MPKPDLQSLPVLFIHGKKKRRQHRDHHDHDSGRRAERFFTKEIQRETNSDPTSETQDLPFRQIEKNLGFDSVYIHGDCYIDFHAVHLAEKTPFAMLSVLISDSARRTV